MCVDNGCVESMTVSMWFVENLNWICPLLITIVFSIPNIIVANKNLKFAKQQTKMQNDGFCFQLLDRRLEVYKQIDVILCSVMQSGSVKKDDVMAMNAAKQNVKFLFGKDMLDACTEARDLLSKLEVVGKKVEFSINHPSSPDKHSELCDMESELIGKVANQMQVLSNIAANYSSFAEYKMKKL